MGRKECKSNRLSLFLILWERGQFFLADGLWVKVLGVAETYRIRQYVHHDERGEAR